MVLLVRLEVLGQIRDPLAQNCDLDLWGPGVLVVGPELTDQFGLSFGSQCHAYIALNLFKSGYFYV